MRPSTVASAKPDFPSANHYRAMVDLMYREALHGPVPSESTFRRALRKELRRRLAAEPAQLSPVTLNVSPALEAVRRG